ncbi:DNA-binding protein [Candidatus Woesearchaeota archaeon]|nr:DNA-binding protein [Candidatus Woesearchaeota archaeon]RLE43486.1 MAG: DNA-binding protein [Candidatus Woesearchaeota archaeon]
MRVLKTKEAFVLRLDKGEELIAKLKEFCIQHNLRLGLIIGLGAAHRVVLANYNPSTKHYSEQKFEGSFEIAMLNGNISEMNGEPYLHIHATIADPSFKTYSGHLKEAVISATCEITIIPIQGKLERYYEPKLGLNLYKI